MASELAFRSWARVASDPVAGVEGHLVDRQRRHAMGEPGNARD